jgi:hypothetical protein
MAVRCPRCSKEVEVLFALDGLKFNYQGPLTRVCEACRDSMISDGDLVPSGTAERVVRAKRVAQRIQKETSDVRQRQWLVRAAVIGSMVIVAYWAWRRFF